MPSGFTRSSSVPSAVSWHPVFSHASRIIFLQFSCGRFPSSSTCSGFPGVIDCIADKLQIQYCVPVYWVHNRYHFKKHLRESDCQRPFLKLGPSACSGTLCVKRSLPSLKSVERTTDECTIQLVEQWSFCVARTTIRTVHTVAAVQRESGSYVADQGPLSLSVQSLRVFLATPCCKQASTCFFAVDLRWNRWSWLPRATPARAAKCGCVARCAPPGRLFCAEELDTVRKDISFCSPCLSLSQGVCRFSQGVGVLLSFSPTSLFVHLSMGQASHPPTK